MNKTAEKTLGVVRKVGVFIMPNKAGVYAGVGVALLNGPVAMATAPDTPTDMLTMITYLAYIVPAAIAVSVVIKTWKWAARIVGSIATR